MPTYIQKTTAAHVSPFADGNRVLSTGTGTDTFFNVAPANGGGTETHGFITPAEIPNSFAWANGGTQTFEIEVDTADSDLDAQVRIVRLDSTGTVLQSGAFTGAQDMGVTRSFSPVAPTWTAGEHNCNNLIAFEILFTNNAAHGNHEIDVGLGTTANEAVTDIVENDCQVSGTINGAGTLTGNATAITSLSGTINGTGTLRGIIDILPLNVFGWEEGDLAAIVKTSAGSPIIQGTTVKNGAFALQLVSDVTTPDSVDLQVLETGGQLTTTETHGIGFYWRIDELGSVSDFPICEIVDTMGTTIMTLALDTVSVGLILKNTAGTNVDTSVVPFTVDTWFRIEIFLEQGVSKTCKVLIANATVPNTPGTPLLEATSTFTDDFPWDVVRFSSPARSGVNIYIDDIYFMTNLATSADLVGERFGDYHASKIYNSTDVLATDLGDTLTSSEWRDASPIPPSDAMIARYGDSGAQTGGTRTDGGTASGPSGDETVDNWILAKWVYRMRRSTGTATTFHYRYGNSVDGMTDQDVTLTETFQYFKQVSAKSIHLPLQHAEFFEIGMGKGTGTQPVICAFHACYLLIVPIPPVEVSGTISGTGTLTGNAKVIVSLSGTISGTGTLAGAAKVLFSVSGTISGTGTFTGSTTVAAFLSGTILGTGIFKGNATTEKKAIAPISSQVDQINLEGGCVDQIILRSRIADQIDIESSVTDTINLKSRLENSIFVESTIT